SRRRHTRSYGDWSSDVCSSDLLNRYFYNLVSTRILAGIEHALLAEPELLAILSALRNLEQRLAIDGRHFDFCAETRLRHGDGDRSEERRVGTECRCAWRRCGVE